MKEDNGKYGAFVVGRSFRTLNNHREPAKTYVWIYEEAVWIQRRMLTKNKDTQGVIVRKYKDLYLIEENMGFRHGSFAMINFLIREKIDMGMALVNTGREIDELSTKKGGTDVHNK